MFEFIAGILFAAFVLPILDGVVTIILAWLEVPKGKAAVKVAEYNYQISNMDEGETATNVIGFQAPDPIEEDDYEDD